MKIYFNIPDYELEDLEESLRYACDEEDFQLLSDRVNYVTKLTDSYKETDSLEEFAKILKDIEKHEFLVKVQYEHDYLDLWLSPL